MEFEFPKILLCETPKQWCDRVPFEIETLLIDHALCEKKAALSAISLLYSYARYDKILSSMAKLAREELMHFDMVIKLINKRNYRYKPIEPSRYGKALHKEVPHSGDERLLGLLILAALIEARSYERFVALQLIVDAQLAKFYKRLCISEHRHYLLYLDIAQEYFPDKSEKLFDFLLSLRQT